MTINGVKKPNSHLAVIINENGESGVKIRNRDRCRIEAIPSRLAPTGIRIEAGRGAAHSLAARWKLVDSKGVFILGIQTRERSDTCVFACECCWSNVE